MNARKALAPSLRQYELDQVQRVTAPRKPAVSQPLAGTPLVNAVKLTGPAPLCQAPSGRSADRLLIKLRDKFAHMAATNRTPETSTGTLAPIRPKASSPRLRRAEIGPIIKSAVAIFMPTPQRWHGVRTIAVVSNGEQYLAVANASLNRPISRVWTGYWQQNVDKI